MKRILIAMILCTAATTTPRIAVSADSDGAYGTQRPANCRDLRRGLRADDRSPLVNNMRNWIAGYITAYNRQTPDTYDILGIKDFETLMQSVENYCKDNPLDNLAVVMEIMTEDLHRTRHQTRRQAGR